MINKEIETEKKKEFTTLNDKIERGNSWDMNWKRNMTILRVKYVKEFIEEDEELINQFACGQITLLKLKQEREKLIGDLK